MGSAAGPPVPLLTVGLEDLAVDDVGQGLQLLLQQALGRQVPDEVPQQGPVVRDLTRVVKHGAGRSPLHLLPKHLQPLFFLLRFSQDGALGSAAA